MGTWRCPREKGEIVSYFADPICSSDREVLALGTVASSSDQQALESLALLVALREWSPQWRDRRVSLAVQSDNIAALSTLSKMQPHSASLGIVARELALDVCNSSQSPDDVVHIPGIANKTADALSRLYEPTSPPNTIPPHLAPHLLHRCAPRSRNWWRTLPVKTNG